MLDQLNRLLQPLRRKLQMMLGRAVVSILSSDGAVQRVQVTGEGGGTLDDIEYIEPFGYTGRPPEGQHHGYYMRLNGDGSQLLIFCVDGREYRLAIDADEAALYNSQGERVHVKNNGEVHVKASTKVFAETPLFECSNDCVIGANLTVNGTTQLKQTTTIEAGSFICAAQSVFSANAGFTAGITNAGKSIGADHDHSAGNETDGSTGTVR